MIEFLKKHAGKFLALPLTANMLTFAYNLALAIADDGTISEQEFHHLLGMSSASQSIILVIVMALLKLKK